MNATSRHRQLSRKSDRDYRETVRRRGRGGCSKTKELGKEWKTVVLYEVRGGHITGRGQDLSQQRDSLVPRKNNLLP